MAGAWVLELGKELLFSVSEESGCEQEWRVTQVKDGASFCQTSQVS